ncbi:DUF2169 family type VI secretion system accessory protein [Paracoccus aminophilus]|nr:DUF2169 domain-containing protein [Paracoccus aminophilus]
MRDRRGAEVWCSAVVGQFAVEPDGLCRMVPPTPVNRVQLFAGPESQRLDAEADFAPFRPRTDIIVTGAALAPEARPARRIEIGIRVGKLAHLLEAHAPSVLRRQARGWQLDQGDAVTEVWTGWDLALGGHDPYGAQDGHERHPANPLGKGWLRDFATLPLDQSLDLPQILRPGESVQPDAPLPAPAGLGYIHPAWQPRQRHAGTYDETWRTRVAPLLPQDFNEAFHQAAAPEMIYPGDLQGGEPVEISGMAPSGLWQLRLPQIILEQDCRFGRTSRTSRFRLVNLHLDPPSGQIRMVWNATELCTGHEEQLRRTQIRLLQMSGVRT